MEAYIESVKKQAYDLVENARMVILAEKKAKGYTNRDLAVISGLSEDSIKNLLAEKPPKNPSVITTITLATSLLLDLNYVFGYTPPQKADTNVVTIKEDCYVEEITKLCDKRVEDVKAMCELRLADKDAMYERIIAELKDQKEISPYMTLK